MRDTNRVFRPAIAGLIAALLSAAAPGVSQTITTGDVAGVVKDSSGAVVTKAVIKLQYTDTNEVRTAVTGDSGVFRLSLLKPGEYTISAQATALKSNVEKFTALVGQVSQVDLILNVTGTSETIEVVASTPALQTENANLETSYTTRQIVDLPMAGGDLTTLAMTVPGVRVAVMGGSGNMNANGIPGSSILFTLNGSDVMDPYNNLNNSGASNNLLGANEVSEAAVVLNAYSAQYGRMAGGQVNLIGKSGTNGFHGNAFYNFNAQFLNGNDFFNNASGTPRGRSDAHQFGGSVGGPILKNRLFFLYDYEAMRYVLPASSVVSLPSPQLETYALAHVPSASLPLYQDMFSLVNASPGINRAIPVTNGPDQLQDGNGNLGCGTGTFAGTPTGTGGIFGVDTPCAVAFRTNNTQLNTERLMTFRVDYNATSKQKLFFRYNQDVGIQATGTSPVDPAFNAISNQPQDTGSVNYTYVITPALVNNFVGSAFWYAAQFGVADFSKTLALMPEAIAIGDGGANGGGFVTVGAAVYPFGYPAGRNIGHGQAIDDLSWQKNRHTFKAGISYRYDKVTYSGIAQNAFIGQYSLSDLADFTHGQLNYGQANLGSSFSQSFPRYGAVHFRVPSADFYVSDEWAVAPKLKLTIGMRFERDGNPGCVENCFAQFDVPFNSSSYQGGAGIPYNTTILTGKQYAFYHLESFIPEPRLGFAWQPFGDTKTVIRGGIGIFSTSFSSSAANAYATQVPNRFTPSGLNFGNIGLATDPTSSATSAASSFAAFESGFAAGGTLAQIRAALGKIVFSTPSFTSAPANYYAPKDTEWSFEVERQINQHNVLALTYVGNHGYNSPESVNANMFTGANGLARYGGGFAGLPTSATDPRFVTVTQIYNNGVSGYGALTIQYRHTFSYGLTTQVHYTWSHALGTIGYENPFNLSNGYGSLNFDNRHQLAGDLVWTQPHRFGNTVANSLLSGWTVGTKLFLYSGAPFSVTDSKIPSQVNSAGGVLTPLADLINSSAVGADCGKAAVTGACVNKTSFATYSVTSGIASPVQTDWGNISPDSFRGPGYFDIDAQLTRTFRIREQAHLALGLSSYNLLNHANFANPSGSLSSGAFGTITSTVTPPTSIYGSFQSGTVSGRVVVLTGRFTF
jgi:hypothetical protein